MTELRDNSTTKYTQVLSVDIAQLPMAETWDLNVKLKQVPSLTLKLYEWYIYTYNLTLTQSTNEKQQQKWNKQTNKKSSINYKQL